MTKAQEKAAAVAAAKRAAYGKRVDALTGHVARRIAPAAIDAAFAAGTSADDFAAAIAAKEPVGLALFPAKVEAVKSANADALATVGIVRAELEAAGWDIAIAAPYPRGGYDQKARAKYGLFHALAHHDEAKGPANYRMTGPKLVKMNEEGIARFVAEAEKFAAFQYDMFICKMVAKVGECVKASIEGNHVWAHSFLTVELPGGEIERWKTQQIINYSKLGTRFPQWPSRRVK